MSRRLHVVHVLEKNRLTTGSVVQMMEAVRELAKRGHRLSVVSRSGGDLEACCRHYGARFHPLPLVHPFDLGSSRRLRRLLRRDPAQLIHVHKGRAHAIALLATAGLGRLPRLVVNRGVSFPLTPLNRLKYRHPRVAAVVCVAEAVRQQLLSSGRLDPARVLTIHGGTDTERFDPARATGDSVRRELGLDASHLVAGLFSLREWKGWRDLVRAAGILAPALSGLRVLLVGCDDAATQGQVALEVVRHDLAGRVLVTPSRHDMPELLAACDVVVDASTAGTGITGAIREAMAMARPVVASDCAGNRELVEHGASGLIVAPGDPPALAHGVGTLLGDRRLAATLGNAARRRVVGHFSTARRVDQLEALYRRLVG